MKAIANIKGSRRGISRSDRAMTFAIATMGLLAGNTVSNLAAVQVDREAVEDEKTISYKKSPNAVKLEDKIKECRRILELLSKKQADLAANKEADDSGKKTILDSLNSQKLDDFAEKIVQRINNLKLYKRFSEAYRLLNKKEIAAAEGKPYTLVIPVRDTATNESSQQAVTLAADAYKKLEDWLMNLSEDCIMSSFDTEQAMRLLATRKIAPKSYLSQCMVVLANKYQSFHDWLFYQLDENHPWYDAAGKLDLSKIPSEFRDEIEIVYVKGVGEIPFLKEHLKYKDLVLDRWFHTKLSQASKKDEAFMGAKFDISRERTFWGRFMMWFSLWLKHHWNLVFYHMDDKDYHVPLPEEKPFAMPVVTLDHKLTQPLKFDMSSEVVKIIANVYDQKRPRRAAKRQQLIDLLSQADQLKPYLASQQSQDEKKN